MRLFLLTFLLILNSFYSFAQDYFKHYPANASVQINGNQFRLNCSVYDSVLQVTKVYNTPWSPQSIIITGNTNGIVTFTFWTNPSTQAPLLGYLIYDVLLHEFDVQLKTLNVVNSEYNVLGGPQWVIIYSETYYPSSDSYIRSLNFLRYNLHLHKWISIIPPADQDYDSFDVLLLSGATGLGDYIIRVDPSDDLDYYRYDPVDDAVIHLTSGCGAFGSASSDEDFAVDGGCYSNWDLYSYDSELHETKQFPVPNLICTSYNRGVFSAYVEMFEEPFYFFTYDQMIHDWVTDTVYPTNITNIVSKNRVIAYIDETAGFSQKVVYMVYNPITHSWDKDSTQVNGNASGLSINDGTVSWNDGIGLNTKGYIMGSGWGNYATAAFPYFHLSTFYHEGQPMIHVRNYSIGTDSVYYDFGDGTQTIMPYFHTKWHYYSQPGVYNVCLYSADGSLSSCQQTTISYCSGQGTLTASADTICYGDSVQLTLSGINSNIQWQRLFGSNWISLTGPGANDSILVVSPLTTTKYRAVFTGASCITTFSSEQEIVVFPNPSGVALSNNSLQLCSGQQISLQISNSGISLLTWESFDGANWIPVSTTQNGTLFQQTAASDLQLRIIVNGGSCFVDTLYANVDVVPTPVINSVTNGNACGAGLVNLNATGTGNLLWYDTSSLDSLSFTGNTYSPYVSTATNFYVQASSGMFHNDGIPDNSIGTTITDSYTSSGVRIYAPQPFTLRSLSVYPLSSGAVNLSIIKSSNGQVVFSQSFGVNVGSGKVHLNMNAYLQGNTAYDVLLNHPSVQMLVNNSGFTYPINNPSGIITVLGSLTPGFDTIPSYYNFYDWKIVAGCQSAASTVSAVYFNPVTASISSNGPVTFCEGNFVKLSASPLGGYFYSWYRNGTLINGAVNTFYNAYLPGVYTARVSDLHCADTTSGIAVKVPCIDLFDPGDKVLDENNPVLFYDNEKSYLTLKVISGSDQSSQLKIVDMNGRVTFHEVIRLNKGSNQDEADVSFLAPGMYVALFENEEHFIRKKFVKW